MQKHRQKPGCRSPIQNQILCMLHHLSSFPDLLLPLSLFLTLLSLQLLIRDWSPVLVPFISPSLQEKSFNGASSDSSKRDGSSRGFEVAKLASSLPCHERSWAGNKWRIYSPPGGKQGWVDLMSPRKQGMRVVGCPEASPWWGALWSGKAGQ